MLHEVEELNEEHCDLMHAVDWFYAPWLLFLFGSPYFGKVLLKSPNYLIDIHWNQMD